MPIPSSLAKGVEPAPAIATALISTLLSDPPPPPGPVAVAELALQHFAVGVLRQGRQELHRLRLLVRGHMALAVLDDLRLREPHPLARDHERLHRLPPLLVGDADDRHLEDGRMAAEDLLDLARVDVGAPADDHILLPIGDEEVAALVQVADVTGVKPAAAERLGGGLGLPPVPLHDQVAPDHDLPHLARQDLAVLVVNDPDPDAGRLAPSGSQAPELHGVVTGQLLLLGRSEE